MSEHAYLEPVNHGHRLRHAYGENVHVLCDAWALSTLSRLCHPRTQTPELHVLLSAAYRRLIEAACEQLPTVQVDLPTRMTAVEPRAHVVGRILDPEHSVVVVDVARAGMIPAHIAQRALHEVLNPDRVRVDHLFMDRLADPRTGEITGVAFHGSKIGGPVDGATMIIPDPMGATGRSIVQALEHYEHTVQGKPARILSCHLIVTPEFIRRIHDHFPNVVIYALRIDRGLSSEAVLKEMPGARWSEERGLTDRGYIVPGAGGVGELINNAFV